MVSSVGQLLSTAVSTPCKSCGFFCASVCKNTAFWRVLPCATLVEYHYGLMKAEVEQSGGGGQTPEELLAEALSIRDPSERLEVAHRGLSLFEGEEEGGGEPASLAAGEVGEGEDPDWDDAAPIRALLLRQAYLAHLELRQLGAAAEVALDMIRWSDRPDVAHHDAARAYAALEDLEQATWHQRLAARHAPAHRRSFHLWCLATLQYHAGDIGGAVASLDRAMRVAGRDRPLIKAHRALIRLEHDEPELELDRILEELATSPAREGYGRYLLGMLAHRMGDERGASLHLRAFLSRNASADVPKQLTLREELRRARAVLARIESD